MSDPEVPRPEQPNDVDHVVDSANAGLDAAAAAGADVRGSSDPNRTTEPGRTAEPNRAPEVDPDLAAFEAAEREHPGLFSSPSTPDAADVREPRASDELRFSDEHRASDDYRASDGYRASDAASDDSYSPPARTVDDEPLDAYGAPVSRDSETTAIADTAYARHSDDAETTVVPSEPVVVAAPSHPQPIFVQAPEPPRDRGNRGTAGAIGLLATLAFAILYLGATIGLRAIAGEVTGENIGEAALAPLMTAGFWTPVVVFFLGFWLLGAIINRGRWGLWVVFGIIVGVIAYGGHILGQLFEAPFWAVSASEGRDLVGEQLLAPLAIAAFVFARELTIWFGAWVARSGARKTELNLEAQREYERTLEAGPTLSR
jgi:hypothetical protein